MIPARPVSPPLPNQNADPKEPNVKTIFLQPSSTLWTSVSWAFTLPRLLTASPPEVPLKCSPRSYTQEMDVLHRHSTDRQLRSAYLKKALETVPLEVLQTSVYFWGHDNCALICKLLENNPLTFQRLVELTPPEKYVYYPGHCTTESQIEILLDVVFDNEAKLNQITDIILTMIGDPRNGDALDGLYIYYINLLIQWKESDEYVTNRLKTCQQSLAVDQIRALKKIENAPLFARALQEIETQPN